MSYHQIIEGNNKKLLFEHTLTRLKSDEYSSIYDVVKIFRISKEILHMWVKKQQSQIKVHIKKQNLSKSEEKCLMKWIINLIEYNNFSSYTLIKEMIEAIRQNHVMSINEFFIEYVNYSSFDKCWTENFMKWHS